MNRRGVILISLALVGLFFLVVSLTMTANSERPDTWSYEKHQLDVQQRCIDAGGIPRVIPNDRVTSGYSNACLTPDTVVKPRMD